jgi:hypothetical protein
MTISVGAFRPVLAFRRMTILVRTTSADAMASEFCSASSRMRRQFALLFVILTGAISACATAALGPSSVSSWERRRFALRSSASHLYTFLHASLA